MKNCNPLGRARNKLYENYLETYMAREERNWRYLQGHPQDLEAWRSFGSPLISVLQLLSKSDDGVCR